MISIIISSKSSALLNSLKSNIKLTIGVEYEIIAIQNSEGKIGICKAYNTGALNAKHRYLCFLHEDIKFHTQNWGQLLINNFKKYNPRVIGVLGCKVKTKTPSSVYIYDSNLNRQNQLQKYPDNSIVHCYENPLKEQVSLVSTIDGMFISCTHSTWNETRFSENYLSGFHGYDIDFSLKNASKGTLIVIYDILLEHLSFGNFNSQWINTQLLLTKKWDKHLPWTTGEIAEKDLIQAEQSNLEEFLKILINNNYKKSVILRHLIRLIKISPFGPLNIFFLRRLILGNPLDIALKKWIIK